MMKRHNPRTTPETSVTDVETKCCLGQSGQSAGGVNRRRVLKSLAAATALAAMNLPAVQVLARSPAEPPKKQREIVQNPRWYGFNLLEYFSTDPDWMNYFPYKNDGMFVEDDFRWIRDWGFNFVRLPMDYRFWTDPNDMMKIHEEKVEPIDRAIRLGEKYGIHVNICLHRAPGYCVLDRQDPAIGAVSLHDLRTGNLSKVRIIVEKTNLFEDAETLEAFAHQWTFFAQRYKDIPSERLSFNLLNAPLPPMTHAEKVAMRQGDQTGIDVFSEIHSDQIANCLRVARVGITAIRSVDGQRLIVSDGYGGGTPIPELLETGVIQGRFAYMPLQLTLYKAEWAPWATGSRPPSWPVLAPNGHVAIDRSTIEYSFRDLRALEKHGGRIHFGEMGCYKYTPHSIVLAWFKDTLDVIGKLHSGWALRNLRGPFGILDTERKGTKFEDWYGHQLDRELLTLLQKKMKQA